MDAAGHHLNVTQALIKTFSDAGITPRVMSHQAFSAEKCGVPNCTPAFLNRTYDGVSEALAAPALQAPLARKFQVELSHFLTDACETIIVFPTVTFMELPGIAAWVSNHPNRQNLQVFFWLVFGPEFLTQKPSEEALVETWSREGFEALERAARTGARVCPIVETPGLKDRWQPLCKLPISVIRLPSMVHHLAKASGTRTQSAPVIGYGGDVRDGKGFEHLPEIVEQVLSHHPHVRFDLRLAIDSTRDDLPRIAALKALGDRVSVQTGSMQPLAFQTFLSECDLILLPYDPQIYALRGSSICDEVEALGLPQIVPNEVSFAQKVITLGSAVGFSEFTAEAITAAVIDAVDQIDRLTQKAQSQREQIIDQNQQFLDLLNTR